MKITHFSSVHPQNDPRIFLKQCRSLAGAGHDVSLVIRHDGDQTIDGVRVVGLPEPASMLGRLTRTGWQAFRKALASDADVYHFHDPELIPYGMLLRLLGRRVVYDIHEDYTTSIREKDYLPAGLKPLLSGVLGGIEWAASRCFEPIIAERYYEERFPEATKVLNYPFQFDGLSDMAFDPESDRLLYTGNVTINRGAREHAAVIGASDRFSLTLIGHCYPDVAEALRTAAGGAADRIELIGEGEYVPFSRIEWAYTNEKWLAGLAVFPKTEHYRRKELTKLFEYMQAGLPIICSRFPAWEALVEGNDVEICVDPEDVAEVVQAFEWLKAHPSEASEMARRGMALARSRYTWDSQVETLKQCYEQLMAT